LSTSPFFHPILPLLCDTDVYLRTHPGRASSAPAVPASGRCGGAARARGQLSPGPLWSGAGRHLALGGVGLGCHGAPGGGGRAPVDGDRRADSCANARHDVHAGRSGPRRTARAAVRAVPGSRRRRQRGVSLSRSCACRT
jgi:hypothetical protein